MVHSSMDMNPLFEEPTSNYPDALFLIVDVDDVKNQGLVSLSMIGVSF